MENIYNEYKELDDYVLELIEDVDLDYFCIIPEDVHNTYNYLYEWASIVKI
tara:strand:+ start:959 stop:1111 length:153 start_codon:yes stop_codon:yes gene_type:complete